MAIATATPLERSGLQFGDDANEILKGLLDDVRRREKEKQINLAVNTWVNAFASFKRLRNRIGLPSEEPHKLYYGALLGNLKATGKMLLAWIERDKIDPIQAGITLKSLRACVAELIQDDVMLDSGLLDDDFLDFEKKFCAA